MLGWALPPDVPEAAREHGGAGTARPRHEQVPPPGRDATLLAVVPIPGTGTSLAIVGYAIAASAVTPDAPPGRAAALRTTWLEGTGLRLDHVQRRSRPTATRSS